MPILRVPLAPWVLALKMPSNLTARGLAMCALIALSLAVGCAMPSSRLKCAGSGSVAVDIQTLDEYPTDLAWAELIDVNPGIIVWRVEGDQGLQTDTLIFRPDQDPSEPVAPSHGTARVVQPTAGRLRLSPDTKYELLLKGSWWQPARRTDFTLSRCATSG